MCVSVSPRRLVSASGSQDASAEWSAVSPSAAKRLWSSTPPMSEAIVVNGIVGKKERKKEGASKDCSESAHPTKQKHTRKGFNFFETLLNSPKEIRSSFFKGRRNMLQGRKSCGKIVLTTQRYIQIITAHTRHTLCICFCSP